MGVIAGSLHQLVETLKAKETPPDVIFGLEELLNKRGKVTASSEKELSQLLTDTFGWERTKEIDQLIMKYALVHPTPDQAT